MTDNPDSLPVQRAIPRLRSWLANAWRNRERFGFIAGLILALVYFVLAGLVTALYVQNSYAGGATFVSLYSHIFRYPQFFGWITILLLIRPVLYLTSLRGLNRVKDRLLFLFLLLIISAFILVIDTQSRNIAPFEVEAGVFQSHEQLRNHFAPERET